jgi:hypothetical protein
MKSWLLPLSLVAFLFVVVVFAPKQMFVNSEVDVDNSDIPTSGEYQSSFEKQQKLYRTVISSKYRTPYPTFVVKTWTPFVPDDAGTPSPVPTSELLDGNTHLYTQDSMQPNSRQFPAPKGSIYQARNWEVQIYDVRRSFFATSAIVERFPTLPPPPENHNYILADVHASNNNASANAKSDKQQLFIGLTGSGGSVYANVIENTPVYFQGDLYTGGWVTAEYVYLVPDEERQLMFVVKNFSDNTLYTLLPRIFSRVSILTLYNHSQTIPKVLPLTLRHVGSSHSYKILSHFT